MKTAALVAGLVLAAACSETAARELECQQRLVEAASPAGADFRAASVQLAAMPREGCTDDQRALADSTRTAAERMTVALGRAGMRDLRSPPADLARNQAFMELQAEIEGYERRRASMLRDLERLRTAAR